MRVPKFALYSIPLFAVAAVGFVAPHPGPQNATPPPPSNLRASFAAYDTFGPGWETTLLLNNTRTDAAVVTPIIYATAGTSAALPSVSLGPHEHKRIPFNAWITPLGQAFERGSLELDFTCASRSIGAILSSVNIEKSLVVEVVLHGSPDFTSSRMEGLFYGPPGAHVPLALLNTTDGSVNAFLSAASPNGSAGPPQAIFLGPHESKFFSLEDLLGDRNQRFGAISMHHDGTPGTVLIQGAVLNPDTGFSYDIPFADPKTFADSKFAGAGILLGRNNLQASQHNLEFTGKLLLRNLSERTLSAKPSLQRGATLSSLETVTLGPGETREITISPNAAPEGDAAIGIEVPYNGKPGDLLAQWFSVDQTGSLVVEAPLRSPPPTEHFGGSNPFYLVGDFTSVTYIKNTGTTIGHIVANIQYQGGVYSIGEKQISPGETLTIDIQNLRDSQTPDQNGQRLPKDLVLGQINWRWQDGPAIVGRTNVMSTSEALASNRSCPVCDCDPYAVNWSFNQGDQDIVVGDTVGSSMTERDTNCNGSLYSQSTPSNSSATWTSSDTSVATVDSSGNVTGVGPGTTTITASGIVSSSTIPAQGSCGIDGKCPTCPFVTWTPSAQRKVTVHAPTYFFSPSAAQTTTPPLCTQQAGGGVGYFLDVSYYVADQNSARISKSGMAPGEFLSNGTGWNDAYATPPTTKSDGSFDDTPVGACFSPAPSPPTHHCETGPSQSLRLTNNGTVFSIATNTTRKVCTDGIQLVIQGNPAAQNKTYTFGNTQ